MNSRSARERPNRSEWVLAWVLVSSIVWATVVIATGDVAWPLVVWASTTFAPVAEHRRHQVDTGRTDTP